MSRFAMLAMVLATAATAAARGPAKDEPTSAPMMNAGELATGNGPIFPDNAPAESCQQNVPLTCPSSATFTIDHVSDFWKGTKTDTLSTPLVAAIESNRAQRMWCQAPSDYVVAIKTPSADLPRGVTVKLNSERNGVVFIGPGSV